jgi:hypothetical protein
MTHASVHLLILSATDRVHTLSRLTAVFNVSSYIFHGQLGKNQEAALKMSQFKVPSGLEHFSRLNHSIWNHQPTSRTPSNDPDFVLIVPWMDAQPRHIAKYTAGYEMLYPSAQILAITTSSYDVAFNTTAANINRISPALEILYALPPNTKLLLHFFSNGGGFTTMLLAKCYKKKMEKPLPVAATVFDSTPGRDKWPESVRAIAVGLPKNIVLRTIGTLILHLMYAFYVFGYLLTGQEDLVEQTRRALNDKSLFDLDAPRVYIYSVADDMVDWRDVEEHGEEAMKLGYTVNREKYLAGGHAGHLIEDPKRYWSIVQELWGMVS